VRAAHISDHGLVSVSPGGRGGQSGWDKRQVRC
jgi:hypothetical protein